VGERGSSLRNGRREREVKKGKNGRGGDDCRRESRRV